MIYLFDLLEFQVLAASRDMEVYYGFNPGKQASPQEIYYAVYQLASSKILLQKEDGLNVQPPVSKYMDVVARSCGLLVIDRGGYAVPRQCVYRDSNQIVCLESCSTDAEKICLSGLTEEEFFAQLQDLEQLPQARLTGDEEDYDFQEYERRHLDEELLKKLDQGTGIPTEELLEYKTVHSIFTWRDKLYGKICRRMILLDLALEYVLVLEEEGQECASGFVRYTPSAAEAVLKEWWREEQ